MNYDIKVKINVIPQIKSKYVLMTVWCMCVCVAGLTDIIINTDTHVQTEQIKNYKHTFPLTPGGRGLRRRCLCLAKTQCVCVTLNVCVCVCVCECVCVCVCIDRVGLDSEMVALNKARQ